MRTTLFVVLLLTAIALFVLSLWPDADLFVSGLFYQPSQGFFLRAYPVFETISSFVFVFSRAITLFLICSLLWTMWKHRPLLTLDTKAWTFLLVVLLVGPGLLANVVFKDHWGRARPREVTEFGGAARFSSAFEFSDQCNGNCSFVSGDASFGFILPALAFVCPRPKRKKVFFSLLGLGTILSANRLVVGAHFLSDILSAFFFMALATSGIHALFYGRAETVRIWKSIITILVLCFMLPSSALARDNIPDPTLTPGEVLTRDINLVCKKGFSRSIRKTTREMKMTAYRLYGIDDRRTFKIDHLVPLALGGADTMRNIWPTDFSAPDHTADDKDRFELKARHLVCTHQISVQEGQAFFLTDWRQGYDRYCKTRADCPSFEEIKKYNLAFP